MSENHANSFFRPEPRGTYTEDELRQAFGRLDHHLAASAAEREQVPFRIASPPALPAANRAVAQPGPSAPSVQPIAAALNFCDLVRAEWQASADLQREFRSVETYVAYRTAAAAGRVKIIANRPGVVSGRARGSFQGLDANR